MPANGRRSQSLVVFEISLPGHTSLLTQGASYNNIVSLCQGVPFPKKLMTQARRHKAQQKAAEATNSFGCPCKLRGFVGEEDDQDITNETKLIFEWLHVRKLCGEPYLCHIRYHNLVTHGRPVPNCPMRLCRPGLLYSDTVGAALLSVSTWQLRLDGAASRPRLPR